MWGKENRGAVRGGGVWGGGSSLGCLALRSIAYHCQLICPSLPLPVSFFLPPSLPPSCCGAERCRENEGQTEIWGDRMMECAPLMNRIREEEEGEEVGPEME